MQLALQRKWLLTMDVEKYVITGAPGAGKTTVCDKLAEQHGYSICREVGRQIIEEELHRDGDLLPWINRDRFQKEVLKRRMVLECECNANVVILDRSILDGLAFYMLDGISPPSTLLKAAQMSSYRSVFIFNMLDVFVEDKVRRHKVADASRIECLLRQVYGSYGYDVIEVPAMDIASRVEFVCAHIPVPEIDQPTENDE